MRPVSLIMTIQHTHIHSLLYTPPNVLMYSHHIQFHPHCHLHCHPQFSHTLLSTLPPTWPPTLPHTLPSTLPPTYLPTLPPASSPTSPPTLLIYIPSSSVWTPFKFAAQSPLDITDQSFFQIHYVPPPPERCKGHYTHHFFHACVYVCMCAPDSFQNSWIIKYGEGLVVLVAFATSAFMLQ